MTSSNSACLYCPFVKSLEITRSLQAAEIVTAQAFERIFIKMGNKLTICFRVRETGVLLKRWKSCKLKIGIFAESKQNRPQVLHCV